MKINLEIVIDVFIYIKNKMEMEILEKIDCIDFCLKFF